LTDLPELDRILKAGGEVITQHDDCARVYYKGGGGGLAMSRALGDEFYKKEGRVLVSAFLADMQL
jgi:hypothetical protein